jgi:hypothetical protein
MALKKDPKITSPNKPPERSSMTHEENEDIQNQPFKLDIQINELNDRSVKKVDFDDYLNKNRKEDGRKYGRDGK